MLGRRAGSTVSVYEQIQCREPKSGQQNVQFYCEDEIDCRSGYSLSMPINVNNIKNKSDKDDVLRKIPLTPETNQRILEINSVKDF